MRQRLGIAAAMLGDPRVLVLDEPANGLDPEGIRWMRDLLKMLAGEGRTVLRVSPFFVAMSAIVNHLYAPGVDVTNRRLTMFAEYNPGKPRIRCVFSDARMPGVEHQRVPAGPQLDGKVVVVTVAAVAERAAVEHAEVLVGIAPP